MYLCIEENTICNRNECKTQTNATEYVKSVRTCDTVSIVKRIIISIEFTVDSCTLAIDVMNRIGERVVRCQ